jgi:hypothetical protein
MARKGGAGAGLHVAANDRFPGRLSGLGCGNGNLRSTVRQIGNQLRREFAREIERDPSRFNGAFWHCCKSSCRQSLAGHAPSLSASPY